MYITSIPNRNSPPAILLRESYREAGQVKTRTLANLSKVPPDVVALMQRALKGEELVALVLNRVRACNESCLGLAADGMTGLRVRRIVWAAVPREEGARLIWTAAIDVELLWRRK